MRRCIDLLILTALVRAPERTGTGVTAVEIITGVERRRRRRRGDGHASEPDDRPAPTRSPRRLRRARLEALYQLEMQLEEIETAITEDELAAALVQPGATAVRAFTRARPVRAPLPSHLPRERVVLPSPTTCPCCGGRLSKLGETITEALECVPRTHKVIQTVREKLACRSCETITQPPAPYHPIARGRRGESAGHSPARQVRRASAVEPSE